MFFNELIDISEVISQMFHERWSFDLPQGTPPRAQVILWDSFRGGHFATRSIMLAVVV